MEEKEFYIISLKWTKKRDFVITLWRSNDNGYCYYRDWAGRYKENTVLQNQTYYNNNESTLAVPCEIVDKLWVKAQYDGREEELLFNNPDTRKALGINKDRLLSGMPSITHKEVKVLIEV